MPGDSQELFDLSHTALQELDEDIRDLIMGRWGFHILSSKPQFFHPNDDARLLSFMNHSDQSNYYPHNDCAKVGIKAGDEITEDYRSNANYEKVFPWLS